MNKILKRQFWLTLLACISLSAVGISYYQHYINQILPCYFCLWQRYLFICIFAFSTFCAINPKNKLSYYGVLCLLLMSLTVSLYHTLIQFGYIVDTCSVPQNIKTIEDLFNQIQMQPSCAKVSWSLFSLPISFYNFTFSLGYFLILKYNAKTQKIDL